MMYIINVFILIIYYFDYDYYDYVIVAFYF
jgi:hypothetical protein